MKQRKKSPVPGLAPEGIPFIAAGVLLAVAVLVIPAWFGVLILVVYTGFAVQFFRDPERNPPPGDELILSPADGRVVEVLDVQSAPYLDREAKKVGIFMSGFDVHVNRNPVSGVVEAVHYRRGGYKKADLPQASLLNEHNAVVLRRNDGVRIVFLQIAGLVARRIVCYIEQNDHVNRGDRMGMIRFGSRVDVYLPRDAQIEVREGDKTRAGETVLGKVPWSS